MGIYVGTLCWVVGQPWETSRSACLSGSGIGISFFSLFVQGQLVTFGLKVVLVF